MLSLEAARYGPTGNPQRRPLYSQSSVMQQSFSCTPSCRRGAISRAEREIPTTSYCTGPALQSSSRCNHRRPHVAVACVQSQHVASADGKVGVVIVDHGSRKKASNEMLVDFGRLYGELTGQEIVEIAHMEIAAPTIEDAVGRCAARGATTIVVAPYFLSRGRHIQEDIPELVRQAQLRHPGLRCVIAEPIGIDPLMVQLISNRVSAAVAGGVESGASAATASAAAAVNAGASE